MAFAAGQRLVDLGDDLAIGVIAVGVDRADRADAACRSPGPRRSVIGRRDALAALYQRPHFLAVIDDRLQTLEQDILQKISRHV